MIQPLHGDDCDVFTDADHEMVEWADGKCRVVFSYSQVGKAISAHFACRQAGLRKVKTAINEFCEWAFYAYEWCRMIYAVVDTNSSRNVVKKCGFDYLTTRNGYDIYVRMGFDPNHGRVGS